MSDKVKIGGILYSISKIKDLARDKGHLGECCGNNASINLDDDLQPDVERKVLLHEIIEAINFEFELNLEHNKISVLESTLYQVIIDNKELIKSFWKDDD
jgi:hypothetical protein